MKHLVECEQKALSLQNQGDYKNAADLFRKIVNEHPSYEFGLCYYSLAYCLEELGELEEAKKNYIKAIEFDNEDPNRLGGYASFLYLHGNPLEAFDKHLELMKLENKLGLDVSKTIIVLKKLGEKLGLTNAEILRKINSI